MNESWMPSGYTPVRELGRGASGTVVLAHHAESGRQVAIKSLAPALALDPSFIVDFRAEARLLIEVDDPNVARLYEYVQSGAQAAMVLELVDGVALGTLLQRTGPLSPEAALVVLKGALTGLAVAHARGVVHRDVKPDNVMVTGAGETKLIDFGIAVRAGRTVPVAGTPDYMAPEQWRGESATPSTDVYAATATFTECVSGQRPYAGQSLDALRRQHLNAPPPAAGVPEAVRPLVNRGMAKDAKRRPDSARALLAELERAALAGYGRDWEERGRRHLGRRALLLAALFPSAGLAAEGLSAAALTLLGRRALLGVATAGAVLVGTVTAATATGGRGGHPGAAEFHASATVIMQSHPTGTGTATAAASSSPGRSPTATASRSSAGSSTAGPTRSASTTPAAASSATSTITRSATATARTSSRRPSPSRSSSTPTHPSSSSSSVPPLKLSIIKTAISATSKSEATVDVTVTANGPELIKIVLEYSDGSISTATRSGGGTYTFADTHKFASCADVWAVTVTTTPAASNQPQSADVKC